jgi:oligopeptide transport system permease protein
MISKFISMIVALFLIVTATFFLMKAIPGDPFVQEQTLPKEVLKVLRAHYHLDDPIHQQYLHYLKAVATWNLGPSFKYKGRTVNDIIAQGFPVSAVLGMEALIIALTLGVTLGTVAAWHRGRWQDRLAMTLAVVGISIPGFLLAAFLQYIFAIKLGWFPVARWGSFAHSVLPAFALAGFPMAVVARLTRASMAEVFRSDYLKTARAKGLSVRATILFHGLRNGLLPVVSYLGPMTVNILIGSFVVEKVFGIPGLGQWFVTSVTNRDYTVIMGMTVFYSALLLVATFLTDVLYGVLDPRIRTGLRRPAYA